MATEELIKLLNETFGFKPWPATFKVDTETYGNVCQEVFNFTENEYIIEEIFNIKFAIVVLVGKNKGIMFKNVELIKDDK